MDEGEDIREGKEKQEEGRRDKRRDVRKGVRKKEDKEGWGEDVRMEEMSNGGIREKY